MGPGGIAEVAGRRGGKPPPVAASPGVRLAAALAACLLIGTAAVARAQDPSNPYLTAEEAAAEHDLDTDVTPVAKQNELWSLVQGAEFGETEVLDGSVTSFDSELHDITFRSEQRGLAGGTRCATEPLRAPGEDPAVFGDRVARCLDGAGSETPRRPVLYRYVPLETGDPGWEQVELPNGDRPGYVGAIAWIDAVRALVVGGTGSYPAREPPDDGRASTDPQKADPAGDPRVWLYDAGRIEELDLAQLATGSTGRAGMRGLTTADCYPGQDAELCFAGGLGQIWEWRDGRFTGKQIDAASPASDLVSARLFRFRVREIRFAPISPPVAYAVTAGCCDDDALQNTPRVLGYNEQNGTPRWHATSLVERVPAASNSNPDVQATLTELNHRRRETNDRFDLPDSFYSFTFTPSGSPGGIGDGGISVVASPGGPAAADERSSVISQPYCRDTVKNGQVDLSAPELTRTALATSRLVSGDGDSDYTDLLRPSGVGTGYPYGEASGTVQHKCTSPGRDGQPDWVVGELRSTEKPGLGSRGLFVGTGLSPRLFQETIDVRVTPAGIGTPTFRPDAEDVIDGYQPTSAERLDAYRRSTYLLAPSYSLNAVEMVGDTGAGWAVGDHGGILRLSGERLRESESRSEPEPPRVGPFLSQPLSEREPYESSSPDVPETAGAIPPLGAPTVHLDEPEMVATGSPNPTGAGAPPSEGLVEIVMSRDGSEGWAIGSGRAGGVAAFFHFDGQDWTRCDPVGLRDLLSADPACAAVAPLRRFKTTGGSFAQASLVAASRVPLEWDGDPSNDNELEIVAVGNSYMGPETDGRLLPVFLRYRQGKWSFEPMTQGRDLVTSPVDVAFTAPDDGWILGEAGSGYPTRLYHFDGSRWYDCRATPLDCDDRDGRLPAPATIDRDLIGLTVAGERVYLYGSRAVGENPFGGGFSSRRRVPLILYRDPGGRWTDGTGTGGDRGGLDPAFTDPGTAEAGTVESLSVVRTPEGFEGWAVGNFKTGADATNGSSLARTRPDALLLRLEAGSDQGWSRFHSPGPLEDYLPPNLYGTPDRPTTRTLQVTYSADSEPAGSFITQLPTDTGGGGNRVFGFDPERDRFELLETGRPQGHGATNLNGKAHPAGDPLAMAPDGRGGFWLAVGAGGGPYFFHYTDEAPRPVFEEAPDPFGAVEDDLTSLAGAPDGSVWATTDSNRVYRHDRVAGWESAAIRGWDPGRVVTRPSAAAAVEIADDGTGYVVGEAGRIARVSPQEVRLDPASGRSCARGDAAPCGTSRDLTAVAIADNGAAIVAGEHATLLWRPAGGDFRAIGKPAISSSTTITAVAYPAPETAFLTTASGSVYRGAMADGSWEWKLDSVDARGESLTRDQVGRSTPLNDIAIGADGHGFAVGERGVIIERTTDGVWRRLDSPHLDDLTEVELPAVSGPGVLIGGRDGVVLTGIDGRFSVARPADYFMSSGSGAGDVVGAAYLPGLSEGTVDAWVGLAPAGLGGSRVLRHTTEESPLLDPSLRAEALPDSPSQEKNEFALAAFGKSDCDAREDDLCPEMTQTTSTNEVITDRIVSEVADAAAADAIDLAVMTGDATDSAGLPASSVADTDRLAGVPFRSYAQIAGQLKHRRYAEFVANPLEDATVPFFAAIGGQDLTETFACDTEGGCHSAKAVANGGENFGWREAFAARAAPWGDGIEGPVADADGEIDFEPSAGSDRNSIRIDDQRIDPDREGGVPAAKAEIGGASTHYAVDAFRGDEAIARIVFVDTSLRSLEASDPLQQPQELSGGQSRFLERMICLEGATTSSGESCTREPGQRAIVVSNVPTYSYGPGALTHTALDATTFEALMLRHDVDLVISGALGYNGLYYTLAPGIHEPCPDGEYPRRPPQGSTPECTGATLSGPASSEALPEPATLISDQNLSGAYPTLIAAGAGGKFGPDGLQASDGGAGQWHGYSVARFLSGGELAIEQRPILDWIGLDAANHAVRARARLTLHGYGRSPISTPVKGGAGRAFHYELTTPSITHRYDLLLADPERPWLPCAGDDAACEALARNLSTPTFEASPGTEGADPGVESCGPYVCLPSRIGTVDDQSGQVTAGDGKYPETLAVATLSVGDRVATYPLVFKRSPSFVAKAAARLPATPTTSGVRTPPPPPGPPPPEVPTIPKVEVPQIPAPPPIPSLTAAQPPELTPPTPPAPPPPSQQPAPLDLSVAPPGVSISTPTALIQPPTPPVNPAPPGGARREARQRQAAAQKGGADSGAEQSDGGDLADGPPEPKGTAMTRLDHSFTASRRGRPEPSFTAYRPSANDSPLGPAALYTGALTLLAFALATGWRHGRPTPRRHQPEIPVPAWSRTGHRRR